MHGGALQDELAGQFESAHEGFRAVLSGLSLLAMTPENEVVYTNLQADSLRDDASTSLRHALRGQQSGQIERVELFDRAERGLDEAKAVTLPYASGLQLPQLGEGLPTLLAAHAKTQGCQARRTISWQVFSGQIVAEATGADKRRSSEIDFELAHLTALRGNSAYAGASNAVHAARAEVIYDAGAEQVRLWRKRAGGFVVARQVEGPRDRVDALRTIINHARDLRSRDVALRSAVDWRRV
jgi:hypothetical protein